MSTDRFVARVDRADATIHRWLVAHAVTVLRISLGLVFAGFGVLKLFPDVSPAESIVRATTDELTFGVVPGSLALVLTGAVEVAIGLLFITGRYLRVAVWVLTAQLLGILAPLLVLAPRLFSGPHHAPTLEGQYVLKDLVLVAAGMVVSATVRGGHLVRGPRSAKPTASAGHVFDAEEKLTIVIDAIRGDRSVDEVCATHAITDVEYRRWRDELLDGAAREMTPPTVHGPSD